MPNLEGLGLQNFRTFTKKENLEFAPITIITGTNNAGKSSVFKAIQLRENNVEHCGLFHRATERVSQNHSSDSPHSDTRRDFAPFHGFNNEKIVFHVTTGRNQTIAKRVGLIMSSLTL